MFVACRRTYGSRYYIIASRDYSSKKSTDPTVETATHQTPPTPGQYEYMTIQEPESSRHQARKSFSSGSNVAIRRIGFLDLAKSKLYEAQSFYNEFSGMSEVIAAQSKVIEIQNQLQLVQERRRHILLELTLVRKQMQDIHVELQKSVRGEHRYVELIKEEFDVIAREKEKNQIFQIVDQEERELFSHLTAAVKTSHEKERTQANNVKYWSIIGSCAGALLGIIATSINYYYRNTQFEAIKKTTIDGVGRIMVVDEKLSGVRDSIEYIVKYVALSKQEAQERERLRLEEQKKKSIEGWGSYLKRNTLRVYRYFIPNNNK